MFRSAPYRIFAILLCLAASKTWAHVGTGIDVDAQGRVYFIDTSNNRIWRADPRGKLTVVARDVHANGLLLDGDGSLYVGDGDYRGDGSITNIWRIGADGSKTPIVQPSWKGKVLGYVAVDGGGNIYRWNGDNQQRRQSQIIKQTPSGQVTVLAGGDWGQSDGKGAAAKFGEVGAMTWGPDGSLFVTDGGAVRRVAMDGSVSTLSGKPLAKFAGAAADEPRIPALLGLAVGPLGNVYGADHDNRCVHRISSDGSITVAARSRWPWSPTGVAYSQGRLYVLERWGHYYSPLSSLLKMRPRVRVIATDGKVSTLATIGSLPKVESGLKNGIVASKTSSARLAPKRISRLSEPAPGKSWNKKSGSVGSSCHRFEKWPRLRA